MIVVDQRPVGAAIVAAVKAAFLRFDQRVDDIGIRAGNGDTDAAERALGHAVAFDALPGGAVVVRTVEAVLVAATVERPGRTVAFPHRGEENVWILRIENDVDPTGTVVKIENFLPGLAAIASAENAALGVLAVGVAESSDEGDVGIRGMDDDFADVTRVFQADLVPGFAAVVRTVNAVAEGNVAANASFAGADRDDVGIGFRNRDAADGGSGLLVEKRIPGNAAVSGFPNAAGNRAEIIRVRLARHSGYGKRTATTERADEAPFHSAVSLRVDLRGVLLGVDKDWNYEHQEANKQNEIDGLARRFHTHLQR